MPTKCLQSKQQVASPQPASLNGWSLKVTGQGRTRPLPHSQFHGPAPGETLKFPSIFMTSRGKPEPSEAAKENSKLCCPLRAQNKLVSFLTALS